MKVTIDDNIYNFIDIREIDGVNGLYFTKKLKKSKNGYEEYFIPLDIIKAYDGVCIKYKKNRFRLTLLSIVAISIFFLFSMKFVLLLLPFVIFMAYIEYISLFKIKLLLTSDDGDVILNLEFDDSEDTCKFIEMLKKNKISGLKSSIKFALFRTKKLFKFV